MRKGKMLAVTLLFLAILCSLNISARADDLPPLFLEYHLPAIYNEYPKSIGLPPEPLR